MSDSESQSDAVTWGKIALTAAVAAYLLYDMTTATETPSMALRVLQYVILGTSVLALGGLLMKQMSPKR